MNITQNDIELARSHLRPTHIKLSVLNRALYTIGYIKGRITSGSISVSSDSDIRRTANITLIATETDLDLAADIAANNYFRVSCGAEGNGATVSRWYEQGIFVASSSGFNFDPQTRTVSISLTDMMADLTGERSGALHAYTTVVKGGQSIKAVIENVLNTAGVKMYDVCDIRVMSENDSDFYDEENEKQADLVPYDLNFSVGASAYDIIEKCVSLYPYYEMGFDADGVFYCRIKVTEQDGSAVALDAFSLTGLVISEDTTIDWSAVKNVIEVWGKDGNCYGEASDNNPSSPFNVKATRAMRLVVTDNKYGVVTDNIYDRYKDTDLAQELLKSQAETENEIADLEMLEEPTQEEQQELERLKTELQTIKGKQEQNIDISGNDLAKQWAERLLYEYARMNDTLTIKTVFLPFVNDTGFKISYRSKANGRVGTYKVTGVSHDLSGASTTLECIRFYNEQVTAFSDILDTPVINSSIVSYMTVTLEIEPVTYAKGYKIYIDNRLYSKNTSPSASFTLPDKFAGTHEISVKAYADGYRDSAYSEAVTVTLTPTEDVIAFENGDRLITENGEFIAVGN